jgi:hypothetical protein
MVKPLEVKDWGELYENAATRKLKRLSWFPVPNSADSLGFLRMREEADFATLYTGWILILATASRCADRGVLASSDGRAYTAEDLALKWRFPAENFQRTIAFCLSLGWLIQEGVEDLADPVGCSSRGADVLHDAPAPAGSADTSGESPTTSGESPTGSGRRPQRKEGKEVKKEGREEGPRDQPNRLTIPPGLDSPDFRRSWGEWVQHRKELRKPLTKTSAAQQLKMLGELGPEGAIMTIVHTIEKGWIGLREPEERDQKRIKANMATNAPDRALEALEREQARLRKQNAA